MTGGHRSEAKFVQIVYVPENPGAGGDEGILALDEDGNVWWTDDKLASWRPFPMDRVV